jgi:hypothetical protein
VPDQYTYYCVHAAWDCLIDPASGAIFVSSPRPCLRRTHRPRPFCCTPRYSPFQGSKLQLHHLGRDLVLAGPSSKKSENSRQRVCAQLIRAVVLTALKQRPAWVTKRFSRPRCAGGVRASSMANRSLDPVCSSCFLSAVCPKNHRCSIQMIMEPFYTRGCWRTEDCRVRALDW